MIVTDMYIDNNINNILIIMKVTKNCLLQKTHFDLSVNSQMLLIALPKWEKHTLIITNCNKITGSTKKVSHTRQTINELRCDLPH